MSLKMGNQPRVMAEELGIEINTVCRWVRAYRRKNSLPSYAEAKGIKRSEPKTSEELVYRVKELEKELKIKEKQLEEEKGQDGGTGTDSLC